jgi:hypothetical protein
MLTQLEATADVYQGDDDDWVATAIEPLDAGSSPPSSRARTQRSGPWNTRRPSSSNFGGMSRINNRIDYLD